MTLDNYPALKIAALEILYDNGIVNNDHSEDWCLERAYAALTAKYSGYAFDLVDRALTSIGKECIVTLCIDDEDERAAVLRMLPSDTRALVDEMLETIFES